MKSRIRRQRGVALITSLGVLGLVAVGTTAYISSSTQTTRIARTNVMDARLTSACEAGVQNAVLNLWKPFKVLQKFDDLDTALTGASVASPRATTVGVVVNNDTFSCAVIGYTSPDTYSRVALLRAVAWDDRDSNGQIDTNEVRKTVDVAQIFSLGRSAVFDYTYFVNNYGWMTGFGANDLKVNGDMRANGDFDFSGGTPTINGSVYACANNKLSPAAAGRVNITPVQQTNASYTSANDPRRRQAYDPAIHGAQGSQQYEQWRDFLYDKNGSWVNNRTAGSVVGDVRGHKTYGGTVLDPTPTGEIVMPDLNDLSAYLTISQSYIDDRVTFDNGVTNPDYGQGSYVKVWNNSTNQYERIDSGGIVNGSAALVGTSSKPILIHGPVTFTQDCVIKGYVQGQGTIYTGRNVHVVGSIRYKNPPDFRGSDPQVIDNNNSSKDIIALAARRSIMMGNVSQFSFPYPLTYMTPPFTKGRYDENGNWIPPFNATEVDETGRKRYQSTFSDTFINSISESVNDLDAILYTSFCGGGRLGTGGGGVNFNGSIICKDEAMVIYSLPMVMNYDHRIRERKLSNKPLIDLNLPRTPFQVRSTWQDMGLVLGGN